MESAFDLLQSDRHKWREYLQIIRTIYNRGIYPKILNKEFTQRRFNIFTINIAKAISSNPNDYPVNMLSIAEEKCRSIISSKIIPIGIIAKDSKWFTFFQ